MVNYVNMVIMHNMLNMIKLSTWPCNMIFMVNKTLHSCLTLSGTGGTFRPPLSENRDFSGIEPPLDLRWTSDQSVNSGLSIVVQ